MKIGIAIETFDPQRGGAERIVDFIARQLAQRGHEIHVLCHKAAPDSAHVANLTVHLIPALRLGTGLGYRQFTYRLQRKLKTLSLDLVYSCCAACAGDIYHTEAGVYRSIHTTAVATCDTRWAAIFKWILLTLSDKQQFLLYRERLICGPVAQGGSRCLVSLTPNITRELQVHHHVLAARIVELPNPVLNPPLPAAQTAVWRAQQRQQYHIPASARVALFVGHNFARKGLRWALESVAKAGPEYWLIVVGGPTQKQLRYQRLAQELKLDSRVIFTGAVTDTRPLYAVADVLILPTFYDPYPLVGLEALAAGIPILTTVMAGGSDRVLAYQAGTVVSHPRATDEFAAALQALPTDPTQREQLAQRCRQAAISISPEDYINQMEALIHALVRTRPA
ncbi:MAG: glycosyltransferase family 4 protein [Phycisphaerae bacterium]